MAIIFGNSGIPSGCTAISTHVSGGRSGKGGTTTGYLLPTLWVEKTVKELAAFGSWF